MPPVRARVTQQYSPVRHLARAIWLNHDPARCWLAVFTVYYDASGSESTNRPLVLAGLLSTERKWIKFEHDWQAFLAKHGVPYLHMKEFAHSRGPFSDWKGQEAKRKGFLREAIQVIKRRVHMTFESHAFPDDYRAVDKLYDLKSLPDHLYSVVSIGAADRINAWVRRQHPGCRVHHVFESGDMGQGLFFRHVSAELAASMTTLPKIDAISGQWFAPFQAADLVAYEFRLAAEKYLAAGGSAPARGVLKEIVQHLPAGSIFMNQEILIALCKRHPVLFPPRATDADSV